MIQQRVQPAARLTLPLTVLAAFVLTAALASLVATAQEKKAAPAAGAKSPAAGAEGATRADDKVILPYIGEDTFIVGRLDVARVDPEVIEQYMTKMTADMAQAMQADAEAVKQMNSEVGEGVKQMREGLAAFVAAGGNHVYLVVDSNDLMSGGGPVLVTPLGHGADPAKLQELLAQMDASGNSTAAEFGKALVFGTRAQIDGLKQRVEDAGGGDKPAAGAERPDLTKAFAAAGDAPLRIALVPGDAARKFVEENLPAIPDEIGGGETSLISQGIRWLTIAVNQKPAIGGTITVRAADAEKAAQLVELLEKAKAFAKTQVPPAPDAATWAKQVDAVQPKRQGETITIAVDPSVMQLSVLGMRAEGEVGVDGDPAPAEPAKPDDGGL